MQLGVGRNFFSGLNFNSGASFLGRAREVWWQSRNLETGYGGIFRLTSSFFIGWAQTSEACTVLLSGIIVKIEGTNRQG